MCPCRFANFRSVPYFESVVAAAYIVEVVAVAVVACPPANESTQNASGRDVVVAYALAFLVPCRDVAGVVPVLMNPLSPCAFVDRVAELSAWVGAFVEARADVVNGGVDVMSSLVEVQNSLDETVTAMAFQMNDMVEVVLAYPHYDADGHNQDCSLDDRLAFQREKDSLVQHVPVAWIHASSVAQHWVAPAVALPTRQKEPSWSFKRKEAGFLLIFEKAATRLVAC